ncbi:hypothetical protein Tco_0071224 [Tanacetum coccineum]
MKKSGQTPTFFVRPVNQLVDVGSPSVDRLTTAIDDDHVNSSSFSKDKDKRNYPMMLCLTRMMSIRTMDSYQVVNHVQKLRRKSALAPRRGLSLDDDKSVFARILQSQNDHFFWVDASVFFLAVPWHNNKTLRKDPHPTPAEFNADVCNYLAANLAPFRKFPEPFLCLVGINRYYELDDNCYLAFLIDDDEGEREVREGEAMLLELTRGLVVLLAGVNEKGNQNEAIVADKPKGSMKKRKTAGGASSSNLPPKRLSEDHGAPSASASTGGKFVFVLQDLLDRKREGGGPADSVYGPNLWTQNPIERFVISSDYSHYSSTNAVGAEVDSIVRSSAPPSNVMTTAVATTAVAGTSSAPALEPARTSIFADSCEDRKDVEIYVPKWNVINDSALDDPEVYRGMVDKLAPPGFFSQLRGLDYEHLERKKFENKCTRLTSLLKEKDVEVANLKAQLSLKEAKVAEALRLRGQVATMEAAKAARVAELNSLKEQAAALEGQVAALESATTVKDTELSFLTANTARLTHDMSTL